MAEADDGRPGHALGLRPFAGVRFTGSPDEVLALTADPPDSWAEVPASVPDGVMDLLRPGFDGTTDVAADAVAPWSRWFASGRVRRDTTHLYVYRRSGPWGSARGLLGVLDVSGALSAPLLPHEEVRPDLVDAQQQVAESIRAQVDPVVAIAEAPHLPHGGSPLAALLDDLTAHAPDLTMADAGTLHELWLLDEARSVARAAAVPVGTLVVADGHHRRVAWARDAGPGPAWGLVWVVDATRETLLLDAVHRVCPGLAAATVLDSGLVEADPLEDLESAERALRDVSGPACVLGADGHLVLLRPAAGAAAPRCTLPDHALCWLHQVWLPAWGVDTVEHVHGVDSALRRADVSGGVAFLLPAPALGDVVSAARRGTPLPAKATSFTPKPRMGLVMRHWDEVADDVPAFPTRAPRPPVDTG